jgi:hypothetical protein
MGRITDRILHAFNAFTSDPDVFRGPPAPARGVGGGASYSSRPYSTRVHVTNERSIIASIYSTMSVDVSDIELRHAQTDEDGGFLSTIQSGLQYCFSQEANLDQAARAFRRDIAMTLFHHGVAAVVPVETTGADPLSSEAYDVKTMRVGQITQWYPRHVRVLLYNDAPDKGIFEEITLPKRLVAIVENPFYAVMNEPNSTLQRIIRKLNLLDITDEKVSNGKLDLIIQLPYAIRTDDRRAQAEQRRQDIEFQLASGKYGIAYADSAEKITQLNRPVENNLWEQIEGLMKLLFSQLGLTQGVLDGTADENTMVNYMARTIEPIVDAIAEEFHRKFLSKTARSQNQKVLYFRDPFKLIPITRLAEISDVFSRNEIFAPNEVRRAIGMPPSKDPKADQLNNSNMPEPKQPEVGAPAQPLAIEAAPSSSRYISAQMAIDAAKAKIASNEKGSK